MPAQNISIRVEKKILPLAGIHKRYTVQVISKDIIV
jgi:hypothetical protein